MINFQKEELNPVEKTTFQDLLKKELLYSKQLEEIFFKSRSSNKEHYFVLQKELKLIKSITYN